MEWRTQNWGCLPSLCPWLPVAMLGAFLCDIMSWLLGGEDTGVTYLGVN